MAGPLATPLTEVLGVEAPVLGAPMAMVAGGELAAAVTRAGGLGFLGGGYGDVDWIAAQVERAGDAPVGVGLITWRLAERPEVLEAVLAHRPAAVWLSFGDPAPFLSSIHAAGAVAVCQVQSVEEAVAARDAGADVVVAQGAEAGGHGRAGRSLMALLPAVVDAVAPTPVAAAGGIADGRGLAAALALGAGGAVLGTRLYASPEADDSDAAKEALVALTGDRTARGTVYDVLRGPEWPSGYTGRCAANATFRRWHGREDALRANLDAERAAYAQAVEADDMERRVLWAGEGVDLVRSVEPAGEIVRRIAEEAADVLQRVRPSTSYVFPRIGLPRSLLR